MVKFPGNSDDRNVTVYTNLTDFEIQQNIFVAPLEVMFE